MRGGNPLMGPRSFAAITREDRTGLGEPMTLAGTIGRTAALFGLFLVTALYSWVEFGEAFRAENAARVAFLTWVAIAGFGVSLALVVITVIRKRWVPVTAPAYALAKGLFIGLISLRFEMQYPGIVLQAVALTFCTFAAMLFAWRVGLIKVTARFRSILIGATLAIGVYYMTNIVARLIFGKSLPFIHDSDIFGIGFSLLVCGIAALNLVLDFDNIQRGIAGRLPRWAEWYGAFGLLTTLVWLYIEMLRLMRKARR